MYLKVGTILRFCLWRRKIPFTPFNGIILSVHLGQKLLFFQNRHIKMSYPSIFCTINIYIKLKAQIRICNRVSI